MSMSEQLTTQEHELMAELTVEVRREMIGHGQSMNTVSLGAKSNIYGSRADEIANLIRKMASILSSS